MKLNSDRALEIIGLVFAVSIMAVVTTVLAGRKARAAGPTFTTIDYPGAVATLVTDINDSGQIVGEYTFSGLGDRQGFLLSNGVFTSISYPGATFTRAIAINSYGDIVGDHADAGNNNGSGSEYGYLLKDGVFTPIAFPDSDETVPTGINRNGDIVGWYTDRIGTHGFLLRAGSYTSIDFPGAAVFTEVWKNNDYGEIAGRYRSSTDSNYHLFILNNETFTSVPDIPGSVQTAPGNFSEDGGLNNTGAIAGHYISSKNCKLFTSVGCLHAFLLNAGLYTTIDYPASVETLAFGVGNSSQVVGGYEDSNGKLHGYLRTP